MINRLCCGKRFADPTKAFILLKGNAKNTCPVCHDELVSKASGKMSPM